MFPLLILCLLVLGFAKDIVVFQLTDVHVEPDYLEGAPALCLEYPCCRRNSVPKNETRNAGRYGDHNCDNAPEFVRDSLHWFKSFFKAHPEKNPDFIIMTGDQATHREKSTQTPELNIELIRYVFHEIKEILPDYLVIPIFGNHDTFPEGHMLPPPGNRRMTEVMADIWKTWIPKDQMENVLYGGYYTMLIKEGWRVIALNCLWHYTENTYVEGMEDAAEETAFLVKWLEYARQHHEVVWILNHVPAGNYLYDSYKTKYASIVSRYRDIIRASFSGHTHNDHYYIIRDEESPEKTPVHVNFVAPAFEGLGGNNPSARLYRIDEETKEVKDFIQYVTDIDEMRKTGRLAWKESYRALETLGVDSFAPKTMEAWAERMWNDEEAFQDYMTRFRTEYYERGSCTGDCKKDRICDLLFTGDKDKEKCRQEHSDVCWKVWNKESTQQSFSHHSSESRSHRGCSP